jgi:transmembrane sensor
MADPTRLAQLITRRIMGILTPEEEEELNDWINESPDNEAFVENEVRPVLLGEDLLNLAEMDEEGLDEKTWAEMEEAITSVKPNPHAYDVPYTPRKQRKRLWLVAFPAAAILILLIIKTFLWPALSELSRAHGEIWQSQSSEITKPTERPTLTLSKDLVLDLATIPEGKMAWLGNWLILKVSSQHIAYVLMDKTNIATPLADSVYNVISLPPGTGNWQITLPDNSKVFLDQGSSLSFSVHPAGTRTLQRSVALNGEAYFEVSHNPESPFILETNKSEIKVHGTSFSIRDYQKEARAVIRQYTGRLEISNGKRFAFLDAAQQATIDPAVADIPVDKNATLPPHPVATVETFDFSKQNLVGALNEIAQYYRIPKIHIDESLDTSGKLRMGAVPKDLPLNQLLAHLEQNNLHFKATEETIAVTK